MKKLAATALATLFVTGCATTPENTNSVIAIGGTQSAAAGDKIIERKFAGAISEESFVSKEVVNIGAASLMAGHYIKSSKLAGNPNIDIFEPLHRENAFYDMPPHTQVGLDLTSGKICAITVENLLGTDTTYNCIDASSEILNSVHRGFNYNLGKAAVNLRIEYLGKEKNSSVLRFRSTVTYDTNGVHEYDPLIKMATLDLAESQCLTLSGAVIQVSEANKDSIKYTVLKTASRKGS